MRRSEDVNFFCSSAFPLIFFTRGTPPPALAGTSTQPFPLESCGRSADAVIQPKFTEKLMCPFTQQAKAFFPFPFFGVLVFFATAVLSQGQFQTF